MPATITSHILMVRPANFQYNPQTAQNNAFQSAEGADDQDRIRKAAVEEFDRMVASLRAAGVQVYVAQDSVRPHTPDAVFPNNWVTFHAEGTVITYPMWAPVRRLERREGILEDLQETFWMGEWIHLEDAETQQAYLEGTGSLILDRVNRLAYACRSVRTHESVLDRFCAAMDYQKVLFDAVDGTGQAIYHTNVMMALGTSFVVICLDSVPTEEERQMLRAQFEKTQKEVVDISLEQMGAFAGNMLQVQSQSGDPILVLSKTAYDSLLPEQIQQLEKHTRLLSPDIPTIEQYGGGSVRCMMAEIFLPLRAQ